MKKILAVTLILIAMLSAFASCNSPKKQEDGTQARETEQSTEAHDSTAPLPYMSEENGAYILTLPKSGEKIKLENEELLYVPYITDALVDAAETKITSEISKYSNNSGFYLQVTDGYLCLTVEVIKSIDIPVSTEENGFTEGGCGIDHEHIFFSERITHTPIDTETDEPLETPNRHKILKYFSDYLTDIGFVAGLSQGNFISMVEQYKYNGTAVTDILAGLHYDGPHGGGWQATDKLFGFYNDYTVSNDEKTANYTNCIYTKTELEGLILPYDIKFTDTVKDIFDKIGIESSAFENFTPDKNTDTVITLYDDGTSTLVFENLTESKAPVEYEPPCKIIYTETNISENGGMPTTVNRTIRLCADSFDKDSLSRVEIKVEEIRTL